MQESKLSQGAWIAFGLIIGAGIFGGCYYSAQHLLTKDVLSVTGSAKTRVTSDQAKLTIAISRVIPISQLATGYTGVARDLSLVRTLLQKNSIADNAITESPVSMYQFYDSGNNAGETKYQLTQTLTIQSEDVARITALSKEVPSLASQGAIVSVQSLEYYYSKLADLRVSLLSDAIKDAKARAQKIAQGTGREVGSVQTASSGVVQVLPVNSVDVADMGAYDTSAIEKEVMVTVKASFRLQ